MTNTEHWSTEEVRRARRELAQYGKFIRLEKNSKVPDKKFFTPKRGFSLLSSGESDQHLGWMPNNRVIVLDVDVTSDKPLRSQLDVLGTALDLDKNLKTLMVKTPGGGVHIYLRLPAGFNTPLPNCKLSKIDKYLKGDIRSFGKNGYVLCPGVSLDRGKYEIMTADRDSNVFGHVDWFEPAGEIANVDNSVAGKIYSSIDSSRKDAYICLGAAERVEVPHIETEFTKGSFSSRVWQENKGSYVEEKTMRLLDSILEKRGGSKLRYYEKRAIVFGSLSCCYSLEAIMDYYVAMGLNFTTSTGSELPAFEVARDFERLKSRVGHSYVCKRSKGELTGSVNPEAVSLRPNIAKEIYNSWTEEEKRHHRTSKAKRRKDTTTPIVVDTRYIYKRVFEGGTKRFLNSKKVRVAWAIVNDFMQTWGNIGNKNVVLNEKFLCRFYNTDKYTVRRAIKFLVDSMVIYRTNRGIPGRSSTYSITERFHSLGLSKVITAMRAQNGWKELAIVPESGIVVEIKTGEVVGVIDRLGDFTSEIAMPEKPLGDLATWLSKNAKLESRKPWFVRKGEALAKKIKRELIGGTSVLSTNFQAKKSKIRPESNPKVDKGEILNNIINTNMVGYEKVTLANTPAVKTLIPDNTEDYGTSFNSNDIGRYAKPLREPSYYPLCGVSPGKPLKEGLTYWKRIWR